MLSSNKIKFLSSLAVKKYREKSGVFLAEGEKIVKEILNSTGTLLQAEELFTTEDFYMELQHIRLPAALEIIMVSERELKKISQLTTPNKAALLLKIPAYTPDPAEITNSLTLALEDISDPGNLGTIIRTADWFGIRDIFCSPESVDVYNPKVIQSTMGAICRTRIHYCPLQELFNTYREKHKTEITGTLLDGDPLPDSPLKTRNEMIVFGNESRGISKATRKCLTRKVKIPTFNPGTESAESLNIASAVAIMCWEIRRREIFIRSES